jgi:cell fate regulator YaaT (PSP1 superfamily)
MDNHYICCTRGCFNPTGELEQEAKSLTGSNKLDTLNWLEDIPQAGKELDIVEVRFKNTRKGFYRNVNGLKLVKGDIVAVEASPGHDIGVVCLTGDLVRNQMKHYGFTYNHEDELKKIYRKAKAVDIEKWYQSIEAERPTMLRAREHAIRLNLNMKIGDVEFQGDKTKAIFYYIADERVDFRELIKVYAEDFRVRIEMKQIGARQEAGRIGAIGTCGRELCCSTWLSNFVSVSTNSARYQEVSLNPQKLAGQCGKLKCCLNYELQSYLDAQRDFPNREVALELFDATAYHQKTDIHRRLMWYSFAKEEAVNLTAVPVERVKEIMEMNKQGIKPKNLVDVSNEKPVEKPLDFQNPVGSDSISRFEETRRSKNKKNKNRNRPQNPNSQNQNQNQGSGGQQPNQGQNRDLNPNQGQGQQNPNRGQNPNQQKPRPPQGQGQEQGQQSQGQNPNRNRDQQHRHGNQNPNQNKPQQRQNESKE